MFPVMYELKFYTVQYRRTFLLREAVSRWPFTAETGVQSEATLCEICGGKFGLTTGVFAD
jgi:hypothetical protein